MSKKQSSLDVFLGECSTHKKLPWKIGAMESGRVAIDSDDGQEVTGWIDPEDATLILNQQQRIEEASDEIESLCQQLAECRAALALKDAELRIISTCVTVQACRFIAVNALLIQPGTEALEKWLGEPIAFMFQHEDTGRTMCVEAQQVEWGFEKNNPRLFKCGELYAKPKGVK